MQELMIQMGNVYVGYYLPTKHHPGLVAIVPVQEYNYELLKLARNYMKDAQKYGTADYNVEARQFATNEVCSVLYWIMTRYTHMF